nr:RES family NAD+ phosphorylase [Sphingobium sp. BHU LFT2]
MTGWPRIIPERHRATPAEAGFGSSRFSSPTLAFRILYAAQDFPTALAEAVIRDRFEGKERRYLYRPYLEGLAATEISASAPLSLVDMSGAAAYEMGIDTDTKGSRNHQAGQAFAEALHKQTAADGIIFSSRLTDSPCVAIFDRAFSGLSGTVPVDLVRVGALAGELTRLGVIVRRGRGR